jgi:Glycosyl hydrolase family 76
LTIAILCLGVVLYRAGGASPAPTEVAHNEGKAPAPASTPTVYQDAVRLCQHNYLTSNKPHWCGELAYAPGFNNPPSITQAASQGIQEFADPSMGAGLGSSGNCCLTWQWNYQIGLWGAHSIAHWWQSALDLETLVWYAEVTHDTDPGIQTIITRTYQRESGNFGEIPFALANKDFTDDYMDDTTWWGLAWMEAAKYEYNDLHDVADAKTFLWLAEHDANYVSKHGKKCGGIEWQIGTPPDTITSAAFVSLGAELSDFLNAGGPLHNPSKGAGWLGQAETTMNWLQKVHLIDVRKGKVQDRLNDSCNRVLGPSLTYTQGEVANAFTQLAIATHNRSDFAKAGPFLLYVPSEQSGMTSHGILEEPCERDRDGCTASNIFLDIQVYKGILMQAFANYATTSGDAEFDYFIRRQASAVVHNATSQPDGQPGDCDTPADCQFVFYWGWPLTPLRYPQVTQGTQMSALDALVADLALPANERLQ